MNRPKAFSIEELFFGLFLVSLAIPLSTTVGPRCLRIYSFDLGLSLLLLSWATRTVSPRRRRGGERRSGGRDAMGWLMGILLMWLFLSDLHAADRVVAFESWGLWLRGFLIYLYVSRNVGRTLRIGHVVNLMALVFIGEAAICIVQLVTQSDIGAVNKYFGDSNELVRTFDMGWESYIRVQGTFFNTGIIAEWALMLHPIIMCEYISAAKGVRKRKLFLGWVAALSCALLTYYRSAWFSIALGAIGCLWLVARSGEGGVTGRRTRKIGWKFVSGGLVLGSLVCLVLHVTGLLESLVWRAGQFEGRFEKKFALVEYALEIMRDHRGVGVGQGNFRTYLAETDYVYYFYSHTVGVVHNIPALMGAESGVIGLTLFAMLLGLIVWRGMGWVRVNRLGREELFIASSAVALLAMVWQMQWSLMFVHHSVMPLFFVVCGLASAQVGLTERARTREAEFVGARNKMSGKVLGGMVLGG